MARMIRALHVEDDPRDAEIVRRKLLTAGLAIELTHVTDRAGFEQALDVGTFDVVLCDFNIGEWDGMSALRLAQERHPNLPVIMISGALDEDEAVGCLRAGAVDYVHKGRLQRLAPAVSRAIGEAKVQRRLRRVWSILEATPDLITMCDIDGEVVYANPAARRFLDIGADEPLSSIGAEAVIGQRDLRALVETELRDGHFRGESERRDASGRSVPVSEVLIAHPGHDGAARYVSSVARDISEQRRALQRMRDSEDLFRAILQASPLAGILADAQGDIVIANPSAAALYGAELPGRPVSVLLPGFAPPAEASARPGIGTPYTEILAQRADGTRFPAAVACAHVVSRERRFLLYKLNDLSLQKSLEAQLRQSQKMEAIGALTGGLAHDFNNLLGVVIGNLDLIAPELAHDAAATRRIEAALNGALSGAELTQRLLAFARKQPLAPTALDLRREFEQIGPLLERSLRADIEVAIALDPELPPVLADPSALSNAILNLAINARDAMPQGGRLGIRAHAVHLESADARLVSPDIAPGDYLQIEVCDTGTGIAPEHLEHVFEPFFTTKDAGKGTGLGLSMVYGFIKQSHGHIKLYSELGHGTAIKIFLPVSRPEHAAGTASEAGTAALVPMSHLRVLVVDDRADVAEIAVAHLAAMGHEVEVSHSPAEVLDWMRAGRRFDLVLSDIVMPGGIDGFELRRRALEVEPAMRFVFVSGFSEDALEFRHGAMAAPVISKPFRRRELEQAINRAFEPRTARA